MAKGQEVLRTREPGGSPGAEAIRGLLLTGDTDKWSAETELLLFTAARRDHLEKTIEPALAAGQMVICDRFADSNRVYQGATRGECRHTFGEINLQRHVLWRDAVHHTNRFFFHQASVLTTHHLRNTNIAAPVEVR